MPKLPNKLADPDTLAREVYDFWVQVMRTDGVEGALEVPLWEDVGDEFKTHFVEAVQHHFTDPTRKFAAACQAELEAVAKKAAKEASGSLCYICNEAPVLEPGNACGPCYCSHVGGI